MIHPRHRLFLRKFLPSLVLSALLFSLLGQLPSAYAQSKTDLTLTSRVGFDGYCKEYHWLPVHVELENPGADLDATVQVSYKNGAGGNTMTSLDILLPANSRKEFTLYLYPQGVVRSLQISLLSERSVLQKMDVPVTCISRDNMIFGVLADQPSTYDVLNEVKPLHGFVRVAQLAIPDLPANAQAWGALDALVVSNTDTGRLTPEQKQGLKTWVGAGGKLLVFGGLNWQSTAAGLEDVLPVNIDRTLTVGGLPALQAYVKDSTMRDTEAVLAVGELLDGAEILVEQEEIPLLVQRQTGMGTVYFFAADPALQPLSQWNGMMDLYDHLLGFKELSPAWNERQSFGYYEINQALATISELGLPSVFYICGLLVLYIVIIGPLHYFVLRRAKRRELAWFTIPGLVAVFTVLAYGSGWLFRGTTPILNRLAVMQAWDGVEQARVQALVGIYSPVRARYDLEATDHFMLAPVEGADTDLQANNNWSSSLQEAAMVMPDVRIEIGGLKPVSVEGSLPAPAIQHDLVISIGDKSPVLSGTITNQSNYTIRNAFIVTPGQWKRLGDISPGASQSIDLSLTGGANGPVFYSLSAMDILDIDYTDIETDEDLARQNAFLQMVLFSQYGFNRGNWGIYLMGWIDDALLPIGLQNKNFKTIDTTLFINRLSPSLNPQDGEWTVPASLFRWEASNQNASPYYVSGIPPEGYTIRFRPAVPIDAGKVKSLQLVLRSNALPAELMASAWNYEEKEWTQIQLTGAITELSEPQRFIGPDHEIKIRVISNRSDWTEISASYITLVMDP